VILFQNEARKPLFSAKIIAFWDIKLIGYLKGMRSIKKDIK